MLLSPGDPARDVPALWEKTTLWKDGSEVQELPHYRSSRVQTEVE